MAEHAAGRADLGTSITPAVGPADHTTLAALFDRYVVDLSNHTDHYALDGEGRWQPDGLAPWWDEAGRHRYLVHVDGRPAGFALVGAPPFPWVSPGRDFCLAEFFVSRAVRRRGVGRIAVGLVLARHPGRWEVAQDPENTGAVAFWRRVLVDLRVPALEERTSPTEVVQDFEVPPGWAPPTEGSGSPLSP